MVLFLKRGYFLYFCRTRSLEQTRPALWNGLERETGQRSLAKPVQMLCPGDGRTGGQRSQCPLSSVPGVQCRSTNQSRYPRASAASAPLPRRPFPAAAAPGEHTAQPDDPPALSCGSGDTLPLLKCQTSLAPSRWDVTAALHAMGQFCHLSALLSNSNILLLRAR